MLKGYTKTTLMPMTKKAFIYCRISEDRGGEGLGVARQLEDCRKLALQLGLEVVSIFTDNDISAYSGKRRPGYRTMLTKLHECDWVLAWHSDRLHRSPLELEEYIQLCQQNGVLTHMVKGGEWDLATPEGMLRAGLLGQVARFESAHKSERIKRKMEEKALKGEYLGGGRPFGWDILERKPVVNQVEADALARACAAVLAGRSLGSIIREWDEAGLRSTMGNVIEYSQLTAILKRPRNAGIATLRGEPVGPSEFPAIVSENVWRAVCGILTDPSRRRSQSNKAVHLLTGIARCHCGEFVRANTVHGRNGKTHKVYRCVVKGAGHVGKRIEYVDDVVNKWAAAYRHIVAHSAQSAPSNSEEIAALTTEASAMRRRLDDAAAEAADGVLTMSQLRTFTERLRKNLETVEAQITELTLQAATPTVGAQQLFTEMAGPVRAEWLGLHIDERRDFVRATFDITLLPHGQGTTKVFQPATVQIYPKGYKPGKSQEELREIRATFEALKPQPRPESLTGARSSVSLTS